MEHGNRLPCMLIKTDVSTFGLVLNGCTAFAMVCILGRHASLVTFSRRKPRLENYSVRCIAVNVALTTSGQPAS